MRRGVQRFRSAFTCVIRGGDDVCPDRKGRREIADARFRIPEEERRPLCELAC